jgi:hypothetical protein
MVIAFARLINSNSLQFVIELCTLYGLPLYLLPVLKNPPNNQCIGVDFFIVLMEYATNDVLFISETVLLRCPYVSRPL